MFIIDAKNRLIAAEPSDLKRWGMANVYEAAQAFAEGRLSLDRDHGRLDGGEEGSLDCHIEPLESLLGPWYRCTLAVTAEAEESLETAPVAETPAPETVENEAEDLLAILPLEEEPEAAETPTAEAPTEAGETTEERPSESDELLPILEEDEAPAGERPEPAQPETTEESSVDEELEALLQLSEAQEEAPLSLLEEEEQAATAPGSTERPEEEELLPLLDEEEIAPSEEKEEETLEIEALLQLGEEEEAPLELMSPEAEAETLQPPAEEATEAAIPSLLGEEPLPSPETEESPSLPPLSLEETTPPSREAPWKALAESFQPDLPANARKIELENREYGELLQEFIQDSRAMHPELLESDASRRQNATAILQDAIALLHLAPLDRLLGMLEEATPEERGEILETYERLLGELELSLLSLKETTETAEAETPPSLQEEAVPSAAEAPESAPIPEAPAPEAPAEPVESAPVAEAPAPESVEEAPEAETTEAAPAAEEEVTAPSAAQSVDEFLEGVTPIPIEFSLHIAAEELNLPEDLVLEFIGDFDKQGHEYLPVLIDAYQKKDLDHLQKTAHMLKGAASNLRIEAMVDNLYDLQFDNDIERAPQRIRLFAGQLMSLDKYLEQMNK
jgi:HPt (histidine-containing phosphotransfer) domain-containing protein